MHIQEFAERVLLGTTLSEKLLRPTVLDDSPSRPFSGKLPSLPNRPPELALDLWHKSKRVPFPNVKQLEQEKSRGLVLHFFANHELLALELMALALLKFPDAPQSFCRGLVHTMFEEQDHMQLYAARMKDFGVSFGEIPVNDFFWNSISGAPSLQAFVAAISLTLEQANLDYSLYYKEVFQTIGDTETEKIMERVYLEELGHVRHGLKWFRMWKDPQESDWEAHKKALVFPLSAARAKGTIFSKEARLEAGLSESYIAELELYSKSKGRTPGVHVFNPTAESQVAYGQIGHTPSKIVRHLVSDFSALPLFFCKQGDVVVVEKIPSPGFLSTLQDTGFTIPEWVEVGKTSGPLSLEDYEISERKISGLYPWGWSPDCEAWFSPLLQNLPESPETLTAWSPKLKPMYSKGWSAQCLKKMLEVVQLNPHWNVDDSVVGQLCHSIEEVHSAIQGFMQNGFSNIVVKGLFGSSGLHMIHLSESPTLPADKQKRIEHLIEKQGGVVVEPWLDKVMDFSVHLNITAQHKITVQGATQFYTNPRGQYMGSVVGRIDAGLPSEVLKYLHYYPHKSQNKPISQLFEDVGGFVGQQLADLGYFGPASIDLLLYLDSNTQALRLKPVVEINPRHSMGRLAFNLAKHLKHRRTGLWLILNAKTLEQQGYGSIPDFAQALQQKFPVQMTSEQKIDKGALLTTDPENANHFTSLLVVDHSLEQCQHMLTSIGLAL